MNNKPFVLNNNVVVPYVGYGTWQITEPDMVIGSVLYALKNGYRHIDTAQIYNNQKYIGQAIKQSGIDRKDIFITSKVWNSCRGYEKTLQAFEQTLQELDTDYLDLYLIHWPYNDKSSANPDQDNIDTWRALEHLYKAGKVRAIGLSNFNIKQVNNILLNCEIAPMANQVEIHPGHYQKDLVEFCQANNILVQAWSPLGSGSLLNNPTLNTIADTYNVSVAKLCLNWIYSKNIQPLPKSTTKENIIKNLSFYDFDLDQQDIDIIDDMLPAGFSGLDPEEVDF